MHLTNGTTFRVPGGAGIPSYELDEAGHRNPNDLLPGLYTVVDAQSDTAVLLRHGDKDFRYALLSDLHAVLTEADVARDDELARALIVIYQSRSKDMDVNYRFSDRRVSILCETASAKADLVGCLRRLASEIERTYPRTASP